LQRHLNSYPRGDIRYVGMLDEQIEDLKKVTPDDVRKFYAQFYGASGAKVVVSGQFATAELEKPAADLFANWKRPSPYTRLTASYRKFDPIDRKIETPDKQNAMFIGSVVTKMPDDDPDYPAMAIANYIFGGSGSSRLFKRVRDKEGLSYGVRSGATAPPKDDRTMFSIKAISNPRNAPKMEASIKVKASIKDDLARTLKDGFTEDEVTAAKKSWQKERCWTLTGCPTTDRSDAARAVR
jgi:zinc protease